MTKSADEHRRPGSLPAGGGPRPGPPHVASSERIVEEDDDR